MDRRVTSENRRLLTIVIIQSEEGGIRPVIFMQSFSSEKRVWEIVIRVYFSSCWLAKSLK